MLLIVFGLSLLMTSSSGIDAAQQTTIAYNAARQQIENVRSFRGAPLANRVDAPLVGPMPQLAALNGGSGTLTIQDYRNTVKRVTVALRWRTGARGQPRQLSLTTLVGPGGVTP